MESYRVIHWLDTGIFPATILFSCGFTYDEIIKDLKKKKAKDWLNGLDEDKELINCKASWGMAMRRDCENTKTGEKKILFYIILKDRFDFTDGSYCKLAHEVLHICQFFLPDILNRNKEHEAEAYLHTHIMNSCLKALRGK